MVVQSSVLANRTVRTSAWGRSSAQGFGGGGQAVNPQWMQGASVQGCDLARGASVQGCDLAHVSEPKQDEKGV